MSVYQMIFFDRVSTRRGQLRVGRPLWGGSLWMRCVSVGLICRRRPHLRRDLRGYGQIRQGTERSVGLAGSVRRVSQSSRSRSQRTAAVNDELPHAWRVYCGPCSCGPRQVPERHHLNNHPLGAQGQFTFLSGEICTAPVGGLVRPAGTVPCKRAPCGAEVSRGHSTGRQTPLTSGRTER